MHARDVVLLLSVAACGDKPAESPDELCPGPIVDANVCGGNCSTVEEATAACPSLTPLDCGEGADLRLCTDVILGFDADGTLVTVVLPTPYFVPDGCHDSAMFEYDGLVDQATWDCVEASGIAFPE